MDQVTNQNSAHLTNKPDDKYKLYNVLRKAVKLLRQHGLEVFAVDIEKMLTETKGKLGIEEIKQ